MTNKLIEAADELAKRAQVMVDVFTCTESTMLESALTAYRAARESAGEVRVKPLVWEEDGKYLRAYDPEGL